jgi:hypothetical protein
MEKGLEKLSRADFAAPFSPALRKDYNGLHQWIF